MIKNLGVMQGRLLPKYQKRYQAHPVGYWQKEFPIAAELGLSFIEFILDYNDAEQNPLLTQSGTDAIRRLSEKTGVLVKTVCGDYFMTAPIHSEYQKIATHSTQILQRLLLKANKLGINDIVIPCVDQAAFRNEPQMILFCKNIGPARDVAEKLQIHLALETDLPPKMFLTLLEMLDSPIFTVNYDTGNSAALGYNPVEELAAYGSRISDVHLKDRVKNGGSVELGTGDADFRSFFDALAQSNYNGPLIMQAYRDDEGVAILKKQLHWILPWIPKAFSYIG